MFGWVALNCLVSALIAVASWSVYPCQSVMLTWPLLEPEPEVDPVPLPLLLELLPPHPATIRALVTINRHMRFISSSRQLMAGRRIWSGAAADQGPGRATRRARLRPAEA